MNNCTLTIPTSVVELRMGFMTRRVTVSGTENLTFLDTNHETNTTPCPKLRKLTLPGTRLSAKTAPFPFVEAPALSVMTVFVDAIGPDLTLPTALEALSLNVYKGPVDPSVLTPLTRLQQLDIQVNNKDPLDLSGLTTVTKLNAKGSPVLLPASVVQCEVDLRSDADLSPLTSLTSLGVTLKRNIQVTFPTGLKKLYIFKGELGNTNIADVALESFSSAMGRRTTRADLERLPKTVKKIYGDFEPASLENRLGEMFPLLDREADEEDD